MSPHQSGAAFILKEPRSLSPPAAAAPHVTISVDPPHSISARRTWFSSTHVCLLFLKSTV